MNINTKNKQLNTSMLGKFEKIKNTSAILKREIQEKKTLDLNKKNPTLKRGSGVAGVLT